MLIYIYKYADICNYNSSRNNILKSIIKIWLHITILFVVYFAYIEIIVYLKEQKEWFVCQVYYSTNLCGIGDGYFNFYTGFNADGCDLLDDLGWGVQINETFVDSHLETIPSLGTFSTRSLTGSDTKSLGWHTDWSFYLEVLVLSSLDQIFAYCFKKC